MSARALISGRIWRDPERRVSGAGKPFASASVRVGSGDVAAWWKLLCFSEAAIEEVTSLHDGDAVSASGEFKAEVYDKGDGPRVGFTLFADRIISARKAKREKARAATRRAPIDGAQSQRPFDDELPM
jgi:hypothetical protein